ncbi:menaquinone biosynthesis protein [Aquifex pyrophilus]
MFRVGQVSYLNTVPLFYKLRSFEVIKEVPSKLVELLRKGEIQVGIVSSVEFFFNPEKYYILPDISISSRGEVCSVKLFSKKPIQEVERVSITKASLTSRYLLHYIMEEKFRKEIIEVSEGEAKLLIGDEAMETDQYPFIYDLGKEWYEIHKLPFVFALFLVRRDADLNKAKLLLKEIKESLNEFFSNFPKEYRDYEYYFKECIDYSLKEEHLKSLDIFFNYLSKKFKREKPKPQFLK